MEKVASGAPESNKSDTFCITLRDENDTKCFGDIPDCSFLPEIELDCDISFAALYKYVYQFDIDNDHLNYIKLRQLFKQCSFEGCANEVNKMDAKLARKIIICRDHRRNLSDNLLIQVRQTSCLTKELKNVMFELQLSDEHLIESSQKYKLRLDFFPVIYSYLAYCREMVSLLLSNLVQKHDRDDSNAIFTDEDAFQVQLLFSGHVYYEQMIKLLIIFYCYFNSYYSSIFFSFFKFALESDALNVMFGNASAGSDLTPIKMIFDVAFGEDDKKTDDNSMYLQKIENSMKCVSIFNELIYDMLDNNENNNESSEIELNYLFQIESKLDEIISIKAKSIDRAQNFWNGLSLSGLNDENNNKTTTNMETNLHDLSGMSVSGLPRIIMDRLNQVPTGMSKENIYYDYWSFEALLAAIQKADLAVNINVGLEVLKIICQYCGITKGWDENIKSACENISVISSWKSSNNTDNRKNTKLTDDAETVYAISKRTETWDVNSAWQYDHIFFQEWIGSDIDENLNTDKLIYRYLFKYFGTLPCDTQLLLVIGISSRTDISEIVRLQHIIGTFADSASWNCGSSSSFCIFENESNTGLDVNDATIGQVTLGASNKIKSHKQRFRVENEDNLYFLMEVNLLSNFVSFVGASMQYSLLLNGINAEFGFDISAIQTPFKIGISLMSAEPAQLGLGLVKLDTAKWMMSNANKYNHKPAPNSSIRIYLQQHCTGLRTLLPAEIRFRMQQLPNMMKMEQNNVGYNYYSKNELRQILYECNIVKQIDFKTKKLNIFDTICDYCGVTDWISDINDNNNDNDNNVLHYQSEDNNISYAVLNEGDSIGYSAINEWIGIDTNDANRDCKLMHRFVLKWMGNDPKAGINEFALAVISGNIANIEKAKQDIKQLVLRESSQSKSRNNKYYSDNKWSVLILPANDSNACFKIGFGGSKAIIGETEHFYEKNMYFMIEVNLVTNIIQIFGPSININDNDCSRLFGSLSIENLSKPFQIGFFLRSYMNYGVGIGLVNFNRKKKKKKKKKKAKTGLRARMQLIKDWTNLSTPVKFSSKTATKYQTVMKQCNRDEICYNYYSKEDLIDVLKGVSLVANYCHDYNILEIISTYCGMTKLDKHYKSCNIDIIEHEIKSKERLEKVRIEYAALMSDNTIASNSYERGLFECYDTILLNEWFGFESCSKSIFRYVFKWSCNESTVGWSNLAVGIVSKNCIIPLERTKFSVGMYS